MTKGLIDESGDWQWEPQIINVGTNGVGRRWGRHTRQVRLGNRGGSMSRGSSWIELSSKDVYLR